MRIRLLQHTDTHLNAMRAGVEAYRRLTGYRVAGGLRELAAGPVVSPEFMARQQAAEATDIWLHGFAIVEPMEGIVRGLCGYKGPPTENARVDIAYGLSPAWQGRGYTTEAVQELVVRACATGSVPRVIAHTLPESNASTRVLDRYGFVRVGEVRDPEDGRVWRWERAH